MIPVQPRIRLTGEQLATLWSFCPTWHACVVGPFVLRTDLIFRPTRIEAEERVWELVEEACQAYGAEFNTADWEIAHFLIENGN
jgi:hypothetical protein